MPLGRPWRAPGAPAPSLGGGVFIKRKHRSGKTSEFQGPLPSLNAGVHAGVHADTVDGWERQFWETDGWEVPDTAAASAEAAPAKWWHVRDERILEMLQPPALAPARSVEEVQPEELVEDLSPSPSPGSVTPEKEKEKSWKVSDEELERLVQEMQRQTAASGLATHLQGALNTRPRVPARVPTIRLYLSVGCGVLVIQVPEDLPLHLSEAEEAAQALRQQKTLRPRRKASIALERLLGAPGPPTSVPSMGPSDRSPLCLTAVIESLTKIPRRNQRLIHQKRIIRPSGTLKELGIFDGHELTLVPKLSKGTATPLTLQSGALQLIEPWRWDEKPKLLARKQENDAGFLSSDVHLPNAEDQKLCRLRTQLGIV